MFDLTADQGAKSPIPEGEETGEEGLNGSPAHNDSMLFDSSRMLLGCLE